MIILLDTSTPVCKLSFFDGETQIDEQWQADRELANGLLKYLDTTLRTHHFTWKDITGIGVFEGPGSFTGLRIGLTVMNTLADTEHIPIVGKQNETWQKEAIDSLLAGQDDKIVMPFYGSEAHITAPRK